MKRVLLMAVSCAILSAGPAGAFVVCDKPKPASAPMAPAVSVEAAWVREAPPQAEAMAGYMTLRNGGKEALKLLSAQSPQFKTVELHEVVTIDGMARMQEVKELLLPAGGTLVFEPGSTHIMLIGPKKSMAAGDKVSLTLRFSNGREIKSTLPVKARQASSHDHHEHHDHHHHDDGHHEN
ncbi:MAG: copper chaperone PCu(A)C [Candidatus Sericytochromatia bacterium]|nr:copper chaperone PCu(A)C [Candidatus Sericytochromatia bacterium]